MRYAAPQGSPFKNVGREYEEIFASYAFLGENFPAFSERELNSSNVRYSMSLLPECRNFESEGEGAECDLFHPLPAGGGVCYAHNGESTAKLFKGSAYMDAFVAAYGNESSTIRLAAGDGEKFGITFYLDANTRCLRADDNRVLRYYRHNGWRFP